MNFREKLERMTYLKKQMFGILSKSIVIWLLVELALYVVRRDEGGIWTVAVVGIILQIALVVKAVRNLIETVRLKKALRRGSRYINHNE